MKATREELNLALRGAKNLNRLRVDGRGVKITKAKWIEYFKAYKVPYYMVSINKLIERNVMKSSGNVEVNTNQRVNVYSFSDSDIHFSTLIEIYEEIRNKGRADSITYKEVAPICEVKYQKHYSDKELVQELRERGYTVTAEKTEVVETLIKL